MPTTPNFNWQLPSDGDGSSNGQPWGTKIRSIFTALDNYLHTIRNTGVVGKDTPPLVSSLWDDEFDGDTLSPSWDVFGNPADISLSNGKLVLAGNGGVGGCIRKNISGHFRIEAKVTYASPHYHSYTSVQLAAINATTGSAFLYGLQGHDDQGHLMAQRFWFSDQVTMSLNPSTKVYESTTPYISAYLSIEDDGTNFTTQVSPDGFTWATVYQEDSGTSLVPTSIGLAWGGSGQFIFIIDWIRQISLS